MNKKNSSLFLNNKEETVVCLEQKIRQAIVQFPKWLDDRLFKGLERIMVNASANFFSSRPLAHLKALLMAQFLLQKKMELLLQEEEGMPHHLFLKLFQSSSRICIALVFLDRCRMFRENILEAIRIALPGFWKFLSPFIYGIIQNILIFSVI